MGNFQHLAEHILKTSVSIKDVACFLPLGGKTGNFSLDIGNNRGNFIHQNRTRQPIMHPVSMETFEETYGKVLPPTMEIFSLKSELNISYINSATLLEKFFRKATHFKIGLLPDDIKWIKIICYGLSREKLATLLEQYVYTWIHAMKTEVVIHKKQNVGRFIANTFLREALTLSNK